MKILVLNSGSSSVKFGLFIMPEAKVVMQGSIEKIGLDDSPIRITNEVENKVELKGKIKDNEAAIHYIIHILTESEYAVLHSMSELDAVGHRVGHGGDKIRQSRLITDAVLQEIEKFSDVAPLHNPSNLAGIYTIQKFTPDIKQVAVFDTAFHQTLPEYAYSYALPQRICKKYGIRRYGFHGTSHSYVAERACHILNSDINRQKIITCHLGNGSSITSIDKGSSIDTSMGFTPLEGLIMGTRPGDLDAGIIPYLMKKENLDIDSLENLLNRESGMLGITELSSDMREIEEAAQDSSNKQARLSLAMFIYRVKKYIGAYAAILNGLDILVFTGGIGENSPNIRQQICSNMEILGIDIDRQINSSALSIEKRISSRNSKVQVMVIPTNEELLISKETLKVISGIK